MDQWGCPHHCQDKTIAKKTAASKLNDQHLARHASTNGSQPIASFPGHAPCVGLPEGVSVMFIWRFFQMGVTQVTMGLNTKSY